MISEFLAANEAGQLDNDRDASDWIEIFNRGDEPASLGGWHLTDNRGELSKWTFPDVTVPPNGYLVVYASGKDRQDPDGELHTNFRLASGGEYLGLIQPDGQTIVSEFATEYPEQFTDVSYGIRMADGERKFVGVGSAAQVWVPTDNSLGTTWTTTAYVPDGRWNTQPIGIGYESNSGFAGDIVTDIGAQLKGVNASAYVRIPFQVDNPADVEELLFRVKFDDGYVLYLNGNLIDLQNAPFFTSYNSTATAPRSNTDAVLFDEIDLGAYRGMLQPGANVLAIHGVNISAGDDDFLLVPELYSPELTIFSGDPGYFTTPTPGTANPPAYSLGPRIEGVVHQPTTPLANQSVLVTAAVSATLHPLQSVQLVYRVMYTGEVTVTMTDTGQGGDLLAGDGVYTASIPASVAQPGQMIRYYVVASDPTGESSRLPNPLDSTGTDRSAEYFGTVAQDPAILGNLPVFQWFTESESRARGRTGARASVFYLGEFYDNVFVRQRGAATNGASQKFNFSDEQPFFVNDVLGRVAEINMNAQGSDPSFLRQSLAYEAYRWAGNESCQSFLMEMRVNGRNDRVGIYIEQVDEDFLERNGLDPDGALYKFVQRENLDPVFADTTTGIEKKTRLDEGLSDIQQVVDGLTRPTAQERALSVFDQFNVAQMLNFLAVRSVNLDADDVRKNFYMYRDTNGTGQWSMFPWDKDWTYGIEGDGGPSLTHPFFGDQAHLKTNANQWNRLYDAVFNDPVLRDMYLRRLRTVMDELLQPPGTPASEGRFETRINEMLAEAGNSLSSGAIGAANGALKNYFPPRRNTLYVTHSIDNLITGPVSDLISEFVDNVRYFVPTNNDLGTSWRGLAEPANIAQWSTGQTGLGFGSAFTNQVKTTVDTRQACATCTALLVRIPFQVSDLDAINGLTLRMKFDDGFVAYLNGVEVARSNFNGEPAFDSRATTRSNPAAVEFKNFNISSFQHVLQTGQNVLAIHSLNSSTTSTDQLILPVLVNGLIGDATVAGIPHEQLGNPPITFGSFDHNPSSGNQDQEYLELHNPLGTAVDISGWRLTGGIEHTFLAGTVIPAQGAMYVTPNVKAFLQRTAGPTGGQGLFVQGNYLGHLSNFGETVQMLAADGTLMATLTTPVTPTDAQRYLRISELNYNPTSQTDATEFIELTNISQGANATTLDLTGVSISRGVGDLFDFPAGASLAPGQYAILAKDPAAFRAAYPQVAAASVWGPFTGNLNNAGETIRLDDAQGSSIVTITYGDDQLWPQRADGAGGTLELIAPQTTDVELLSKPSVWRGSTEVGGSPGRVGLAPLGIVINEVLAKTDGQAGVSDTVELLNVSDVPINLSGWYLSDSDGQFKKFAMPTGTIINPGGYLLLTESQFNQGANGFALNGDEGDDLWLVATDAATGNVVRFADDVQFGASRSGESWGRRPNGTGRLWPQSPASFGQANEADRVGPLVISELHYHPAPPTAAAVAIDPSLSSEDLEFIEIFNASPAPVHFNGWQLRGDVDFDFREGTVLAQQQTLLLVSFNPLGEGNGSKTRAFRAHYGLGEDVLIVGGYQGELSDSYGRVELQRPGTPPIDNPSLIPRLFEDEVSYDDRLPWPVAADGTGSSLQRSGATVQGNQASNWQATTPSPGSFAAFNADLNGDGQVNASDIDRLCQAIRAAETGFDLTGDGTVGLDDFQFYLNDVLGTSIGDANLDRVFNSTDFVVVFQAGEYEDVQVGNSTWAEGDWNCDTEFNTQDLVAAFQSGAFVAAAILQNEPPSTPRPVREPSLAAARVDRNARQTIFAGDDWQSRQEWVSDSVLDQLFATPTETRFRRKQAYLA